MKLGFKRGQKGFTLVELMVVMAILAVLAAIVFPAVSGTSEVAGDSQVKQDASTVNTAVSDYYGDMTGAEIFTTNTTSILGVSGTKDVAQITTTRWPEKYLTVAYLLEFPLLAATDNASVVRNVNVSVNITEANPSGTTITEEQLAEGWNAINLANLAALNYIPAVPKSDSDLSNGMFHNYLWLVRKTTTTSGGVDTPSRDVDLFKLTRVDQDELSPNKNNYTLTYEQIY